MQSPTSRRRGVMVVRQSPAHHQVMRVRTCDYRMRGLHRPARRGHRDVHRREYHLRLSIWSARAGMRCVRGGQHAITTPPTTPLYQHLCYPAYLARRASPRRRTAPRGPVDTPQRRRRPRASSADALVACRRGSWGATESVGERVKAVIRVRPHNVRRRRGPAEARVVTVPRRRRRG